MQHNHVVDNLYTSQATSISRTSTGSTVKCQIFTCSKLRCPSKLKTKTVKILDVFHLKVKHAEREVVYQR